MQSTGAIALAVLTFVATGGLLALAALLIIWARMTGRTTLVPRVWVGAAGLAVSYLLIWFGTAVLSDHRLLPVATEKYFCELDCHLAYAVTDVQLADRYTLITVRTRFDETTISRRRPREAPLWPAPRRVLLVDDRAASHMPVPDQVTALQLAGALSSPFTRELRPGESYTTTLAFELPAGARPARLLIEDDLLVSRFLIGHERSPFHAKTWLAL